MQLKRQALRPRTAVEESSLFYFGLQLIQPTYFHTYTKTLSSFLLPETDGCSCIIDYFSICIYYAPLLFIILSADEIHFLFFSGSGGEQQTEQEVGQVQTNLS